MNRGGEARYGCSHCLSVFRVGFSHCPIDGSALQHLTGDPLVGNDLDRYVIEECIGEGGMGRVYRARHQRVNRLFAVKVLFGDFATDPVMRGRFSREAEATSRLSHPNVISVIDFGETREGLLYLAMDYVAGHSLETMIEREGPLLPKRILSLMRQLCSGLAHAHEQGLVHRDFKSDNVLVTSQGEELVARIVDFGIAVLLEDAGQRFTSEGIVVGTPAYMAPEQATGQGVDPRADLYSLGVMLYEMLAGVLPFEGSPLEIAQQNVVADPPPIAERVPGLEVSPPLEHIARRLMEKRPEDRFQSACAVLEALEWVRAEPATPAWHRSTRRITRARLSAAGRRRRLLLAAPVLATALALGSLLAQRGGGGARNTAVPPEGAAIEQPVRSAPDFGAMPISPPAAIPVRPLPTPPSAEVATPPPSESPPRPRRRKRLPRDRGPESATSPATSSPRSPTGGEQAGVAQATPTPADLTQLYVSVGEALQILETRDPARARRLRREYGAIPFSDALRIASLRREVERKLQGMRRQLDGAGL